MRQEIVDEAVSMFISSINRFRSSQIKGSKYLSSIREVSKAATRLVRKTNPELTKEQIIKYLVSYFAEKDIFEKQINLENLIDDFTKIFGKLEEDEIFEITNQIHKSIFSNCMKDTLSGIEDAFNEDIY